MKLSGVGLEPHECNDEFLSKRLGLNKAVLIFVGVILGLIVSVGLILFFDKLATSDFENALPFLVMIPAFGLIFGIPGFFVFREARAIQKELDKRSAEDEEDAINIEETTKKNTRRSLIAIACFIIIAVIVIFKIIGGAIDNHGGSGGSGSTTCPNCGTSYRSDHSAADFIRDNGYCSTCRGR